MLFQKKVLVTGGTGFIGNYITKTLAQRKPETLVISLSRSSVEDQKKRDEQTSNL